MTAPISSRSSFAGGVCLALALAAALLALPAPAVASAESEELIRQGWEAFRQGRLGEAIGRFEAAVKADPNDPDALFYLGAVLNRDGRPGEALERLEEARRRDGRHADLGFEIGWSLLNVGRFAEAVAELERYEQVRAGRAKTSEFLGRALLGLGRLDDAERKLQEALARDAALKPGVLYYLALIERERGRPAAARARLEELLREAPDSAFARSVREEIERAIATTPPPPKPWRLMVSAGGGYNTNVIALADGVPPPIGVSGKRSGFARFNLNAAWDWRLGANDGLTAEYGFLSDVYESIPTSDLRDHSVSLDVRHRFSPRLVASLRVGDEYTEIHDESFRNQVTVRPALASRLKDWAVVEVAYSFTASDYFAKMPALYDRDAHSQSAAANGYVTVPGTRLGLRVGYFHVWTHARGREFSLETDGLMIGASHPLVWKITADVAYTRTQDNYDHPNSLAGVGGFEFRREDTSHALSVQLGRPLLPWLGAYARYDRVETDSNVRVNTFQQHIWSGGLVASF